MLHKVIDVTCRVDGASAQKLEALLKENPNLKKLTLDFGSCGVGSDEIGAIGAALPPDLEELVLDFVGCGITDEGIECLVASLPCNIQRLNIDLSYCPMVGDRGLVALGSALKPSLISLRIILLRCVVSDVGVGALGACLPSGLRELTLSCGKCRVADAGLMALANNLPQGLARLELDFCNCQIGFEGAEALGVSLPGKLEELRLNFEACPIQDFGAVAIVAGVPSEVVVLELSFAFCELSDVMAASLSQMVADAPGLHRLRIDLRHNLACSDEGLIAIGNSLPRDLHELFLDFTGCGVSTLGQQILCDAVAWLPELQEQEVNVDVPKKRHPLGLKSSGPNKLSAPSNLKQPIRSVS